MIVNELAKAAGVEPHVVRYYTRIGLLRPARHPDNGYKMFRPSDIRRLEWIRRAQELGFGLTEVAAFLEAQEAGETAMVPMCESLRQNIERNRSRLSELQKLQARMEAAMNAWDRFQTGPLRDLAAADVTASEANGLNLSRMT